MGTCLCNLKNVLFLRGNCESHSWCGIGKGFWRFKNTNGQRSFWNLENVLSPPRGNCENRSQWSPLTVFRFLGLGSMFGFSITLSAAGIFKILQIFYPPQGVCERSSKWGPIVSTCVLLVSRFMRKGWDYMPQDAFLISWNYFIPWRVGESSSQRVQVTPLTILFALEWMFGVSRILSVTSTFEILKIFYPLEGVSVSSSQ